MTLASTCVKAGEKQTITIKTAPDSAVGYNSYYPDGKSGLDKENGFYGGNNGGPVPESGVWSDTWTISAAAPTGTVRVTIGGAHVDYDPANEERTFHVAGQGSSCP